MALEIQLKWFGGAHVAVADMKYNLARVYRRQGDHIKADNLFQEAAAVYATVYGSNDSRTLYALYQAKGTCPVHSVVMATENNLESATRPLSSVWGHTSMNI
jgi:hypothetical protein